MNPLTEAVNINEYPRGLIRPLYLYVLNGPETNSEALKLSQDFLNYVRSVKGQQVLESHHFYNHFRQPADVRIQLPPGFAEPVVGPRSICRSL